LIQRAVKKIGEKGRDDDRPAFNGFKNLIYDILFFLPKLSVPTGGVGTERFGRKKRKYGAGCWNLPEKRKFCWATWKRNPGSPYQKFSEIRVTEEKSWWN